MYVHFANVDIQQFAQPKRVILTDRRGRLPLTAKILENPCCLMVVGPYYRQELAAGDDTIKKFSL